MPFKSFYAQKKHFSAFKRLYLEGMVVKTLEIKFVFFLFFNYIFIFKLYFYFLIIFLIKRFYIRQKVRKNSSKFYPGLIKWTENVNQIR